MRISDWSSDVCSSDLVVVHLFDTIIHKLLHQGVLRKGLRRRHIDQARVIALIEMAVLRIHHSCLSIAHEVLAKVLVECVAVALELREFVRPALILVFGPRRLLAETLRMTKVLRHLLTKSADLAI